MHFSGDYVTIQGNFVLTSLPVANDPNGPIITGIGNWDFSGSYHVSDGNLVADSSDIDTFQIKLTLNGTTVAGPPRLTSFTPGQIVPFTCSGDRLTIVEAGASGSYRIGRIHPSSRFVIPLKPKPKHQPQKAALLRGRSKRIKHAGGGHFYNRFGYIVDGPAASGLVPLNDPSCHADHQPGHKVRVNIRT